MHKLISLNPLHPRNPRCIIRAIRVAKKSRKPETAAKMQIACTVSNFRLNNG
jgi:hypothetical protein